MLTPPVLAMVRGNNDRRRENASRTDVWAKYRNHFLIWLASMLCYANSLTGDFVFDDHEAIETNVDIRPTTPLWSLFTNDFWGEPIHSNTSHKSYRPLTILTFRWNYAIGGLDPTGYHFVNIILHGLVSALFVSTCDVIFHGMTSCHSLTLLASLLFVVHPIHTEAVASVVGRADLLCTFFYLLCFLSYAKCVNVRTSKTFLCIRPVSYSRIWLFISVVFCILSLLSKEQGLTALAVCIIYDILYICSINFKDVMFFLQNSVFLLKSFKLWSKWVKRLLERISLLMLSCIALLYIRIVVVGGGVPKTFVESDNPAYFHPDHWTRLRTYMYIWFYNAWLLLCPSTLCFDWSMDSISRIESWLDLRNVMTLCFVSILSLMTWKATRLYTCNPIPTTPTTTHYDGVAPKDVNKNHIKENKQKNNKAMSRQLSPSNLLGRNVLQATAMIIIPFIPASNLFFPVGFVIAERILYISSTGFCMLVALGFHSMFEVHTKDNTASEEHSKSTFFPPLNISVKGRVTLYVLLVLMGLKTLYRNAEWQNTGTLAYAGISVNPTNAKMHLCMGNYLAKKGYRSCEKHYREALRLRPQYTLAWVNLGLVLINTDRPEEAEKCYLKALSINPDSANANTNLANLLRIQERYTEAESRYRKAMTLRPDDPMLYLNLGYVLEMLRKPKEATKNYLQSIAMMPSIARAYFGVARILITPMNDEQADKDAMHSLAMAEEYLMLGLRYDKTDIQAKLLYAKVLMKRRELVLAKNELLNVLSQDQNNVEANYLAGRLMEREGRLEDARELFEFILNINRTHAKTIQALKNLKVKITNTNFSLGGET